MRKGEKHAIGVRYFALFDTGPHQSYQGERGPLKENRRTFGLNHYYYYYYFFSFLFLFFFVSILGDLVVGGCCSTNLLRVLKYFIKNANYDGHYRCYYCLQILVEIWRLKKKHPLELKMDGLNQLEKDQPRNPIPRSYSHIKANILLP